MMGWQLLRGTYASDLVPVGDLKPHYHGKDCWCRPTACEDNEDDMIHNAMDRREDYEEGRLRLH